MHLKCSFVIRVKSIIFKNKKINKLKWAINFVIASRSRIVAEKIEKYQTSTSGGFEDPGKRE